MATPFVYHRGGAQGACVPHPQLLGMDGDTLIEQSVTLMHLSILSPSGAYQGE